MTVHAVGLSGPQLDHKTVAHAALQRCDVMHHVAVEDDRIPAPKLMLRHHARLRPGAPAGGGEAPAVGRVSGRGELDRERECGALVVVAEVCQASPGMVSMQLRAELYMFK